MYAFGDMKEPANDTVEVMEEILIEYLVDVVSYLTSHLEHSSTHALSLTPHSPPLVRLEYRSKTLDVPWEDMPMERNWHGWRSSFSCKMTYEGLGSSFPQRKKSWRKDKHW